MKMQTRFDPGDKIYFVWVHNGCAYVSDQHTIKHVIIKDLRVLYVMDNDFETEDWLVFGSEDEAYVFELELNKYFVKKRGDD